MEKNATEFTVHVVFQLKSQDFIEIVLMPVETMAVWCKEGQECIK